MHSALYDGTPEYLAALLLQHAPPRSLRSAGGLLLEVPRVNLEHFGRHGCAGPTLWNKLPRNMRDDGNLFNLRNNERHFIVYVTIFTQRILYFSLTCYYYILKIYTYILLTYLCFMQ